jgi:hypothetical protein
MVDQLQTFDLNEHHHEIFVYDDVHDLDGRILAKDSRPLIGSILMSNKPSSFENIVIITTLALGSQPRQGFAKVRTKSEA